MRSVPGDEITEYYSARWLGASEACWRIFGFSMHSIKPAIYRLQIHEEDEQRVAFDPAIHTNGELQAKEALRRTTLTEYFELNAVAKQHLEESREVPFLKNPLDLLYIDVPEYFTWHKRDKQWTSRKRGDTIGRMYFLGPKAGDRFYLRLLLSHVKGATSFEDLRTVDGRVCSTYQEACILRGLTKNDREWDEALMEASQTSTGAAMRRLFVIILIECNPSDPESLWEAHKDGSVIENYRIWQ